MTLRKIVLTVLLAVAGGLAVLLPAAGAARQPHPPGQPVTDVGEYSVPGSITLTSFAADGVTPVAATTLPAAAASSGQAASAGTVIPANCCSTSGCQALDVSRNIYSGIFNTLLGTFHHRVYWCWSYPRITGVDVSCYSNVNGTYIQNNGCGGWGNYYGWAGSSQGGHVSWRQASWGNCVFHYGCFKTIYPTIEIWVNGNGAWSQQQSG